MLGLSPGATVVDGTLGDGGHAEAVLRLTAPDGLLLGLDWDAAALAVAEERLAPFGERVELVHAPYAELAEVLAERSLDRVDAILLDLGVSSRQLDSEERGFRFRDAEFSDAVLDMRMDSRAELRAADLLATASEESLGQWFARYGELPGAHRLARTIVSTRKQQPIRTAAELIAVIRRAGVGRGRRHNPATLVFQALRIAVNDELGGLTRALETAPECLRAGGRLAVIAYHSLEDRLVKHALRDGERGCICPPRIPVCVCGQVPVWKRLNKRPVTAEEQEVEKNPRARSAKLRGASRLTYAEAA